MKPESVRLRRVNDNGHEKWERRQRLVDWSRKLYHGPPGLVNLYAKITLDNQPKSSPHHACGPFCDCTSIEAYRDPNLPTSQVSPEAGPGVQHRHLDVSHLGASFQKPASCQSPTQKHISFIFISIILCHPVILSSCHPETVDVV